MTKEIARSFTSQHLLIDKSLTNKDILRQANINIRVQFWCWGRQEGFLAFIILKIANNVVAIENDTKNWLNIYEIIFWCIVQDCRL